MSIGRVLAHSRSWLFKNIWTAHSLHPCQQDSRATRPRRGLSKLLANWAGFPNSCCPVLGEYTIKKKLYLATWVKKKCNSYLRQKASSYPSNSKEYLCPSHSSRHKGNWVISFWLCKPQNFSLRHERSPLNTALCVAASATCRSFFH